MALWAVDFNKESEATRGLYGIGERITDDFGRSACWRQRLVERGARFIQIRSGINEGSDWDEAHNDLIGLHNRMAGKTDKPIAALPRDPKAHGLLDLRLVVWGGEFGRTPLSQGQNAGTIILIALRRGWQVRA